MKTTDTPRTDAVPCNQLMLSAQSDPVELYHKLIAVTVDFGKALDACVEYRDQLAASKAEVELLKQGKVFVDPKWIYDLEAQLAKAHEELCQAGLREYGN